MKCYAPVKRNKAAGIKVWTPIWVEILIPQKEWEKSYYCLSLNPNPIKEIGKVIITVLTLCRHIHKTEESSLHQKVYSFIWSIIHSMNMECVLWDSVQGLFWEADGDKKSSVKCKALGNCFYFQWLFIFTAH